MGPNVYVGWRDSSIGNNEIYLSKSTDYGTTFTDPINLSNSTGDSSNQNIAASDINLYTVWSDDSIGNGDILFVESNNYGATFGKTKNLSNNPEQSTHPQVSLIGNREYVLWRDETSQGGKIKLTDKVSSAIDFSGGLSTDPFATDPFATDPFVTEQFPSEQFPSEQFPQEGQSHKESHKENFHKEQIIFPI